MNASKNILIGEPISDLRELCRLSEEKKSVVVFIGGKYCVKPASWIAQWSVAMLQNIKLFYSIKNI